MSLQGRRHSRYYVRVGGSNSSGGVKQVDALTQAPETPLGESLGVDATALLGRSRFDRELPELPDHELVEVMVAARRLASRVQAVELAAVAELARRRFAAG